MTEAEKTAALTRAAKVVREATQHLSRDVVDELADLQRRYQAACEHAAGVKPGDRVELVRVPQLDRSHGWWGARETFRLGARGTVLDVAYNDHWKYFAVHVAWDVERWTYDPGNGKPVEVRETEPGQRGSYCMNADQVRRIEEGPGQLAPAGA